MSYSPYKTEKELLERLRRTPEHNLEETKMQVKYTLEELFKNGGVPEECIGNLVAFITQVTTQQIRWGAVAVRTNQILELLYCRHPEMKKELMRIPTDLGNPDSLVNPEWEPGYFEIDED